MQIDIASFAPIIDPRAKQAHDGILAEDLPNRTFDRLFLFFAKPNRGTSCNMGKPLFGACLCTDAAHHAGREFFEIAQMLGADEVHDPPSMVW